MKFALDTNILVYVEGVNGAAREKKSRELIARLPEALGIIPTQALGELYNVLTRKAAWPADRASDAALAWGDTFALAPTTASAMFEAFNLAADHRLHIWDSVMMSVAAEAGCRLFLSEDMQNGFTWRGVTVVNPFAQQPHPLLASLLGAADDGEQG
jgi:predicted nucleic acid-binding protein